MHTNAFSALSEWLQQPWHAHMYIYTCTYLHRSFLFVCMYMYMRDRCANTKLNVHKNLYGRNLDLVMSFFTQPTYKYIYVCIGHFRFRTYIGLYSLYFHFSKIVHIIFLYVHMSILHKYMFIGLYIVSSLYYLPSFML